MASRPPSYSHKQWEIYQVQWEHEDGSMKERPALVISPTTDNQKRQYVWFMKITGTAIHSPHFMLDPLDPAFSKTGLKKKSYFDILNVRKIPKNKILNLRGRVGQMTAFAINQLILDALKTLPWT